MTNAESSEPDSGAQNSRGDGGVPAHQLLLELARLRDEVARLEESARTREEQTALVVHELRHSLNLLILNAAFLARRTVGDEQRALEGLRSGGFRLDVMISDLSDVSLVESGRFTLDMERTDIARLVTAHVEAHAPGTVVAVEGAVPLLDVDPRRVGQILANLLVNARKHGREGSRAQVRVARRGDDVVIDVTSEGGGISDDERTRVFEPYYRARGCKPGAHGLGLGLYICRLLVDSHGGRIWTDGDSSQTRFSFSLPITHPATRISETRLIALTRARDGNRGSPA